MKYFIRYCMGYGNRYCMRYRMKHCMSYCMRYCSVELGISLLLLWHRVGY